MAPKIASIDRAIAKAGSYARSGDAARARELYRAVLAAYPENRRALAGLDALRRRSGAAVDPTTGRRQIDGVLSLYRAGRFREAMGQVNDLIDADPKAPLLHNIAGAIHAALGDTERAIACYRTALEIAPDYADVHNNLGNLLNEAGEFAEAVASYRRALDLQPDYAEAHNNLGLALRNVGQPEAAVASHRKALEFAPDHPGAHNNLGTALCRLGRYEQAIASYRKALAIKPDYAEAHNNLGTAFKDIGAHRQAIASYRAALRLKPEAAAYHCNLAYQLLLAGDFAAGWREHEWRWQKDDLRSDRRDFAQPLWRGDTSLDGKAILLHSEQGYGDAIQFARFAQAVVDRGARVVLEVPPALAGVMTTLDGPIRVVARGEALPDFDCYCPLMSLPLAFGIAIDTIPAATPYLFSDPQRVAGWRQELGVKTKPRVGLVWSGRAEHRNDHNRSIPLTCMRSLLSTWAQNIEWIVLQKELREGDAAVLETLGLAHDVGSRFKDFADAAAVIDLVDIVITVDTSVAHLAGAMGKPVWILLPAGPDWRWLLDRDDSPWYPTARLFRQTAVGDWAGALARVADALATLAVGGSRQ